MKFHPSSLGKIMTNGPMPAVPKARKSTRKPKTPEDQAVLEAENAKIDEDYAKALAAAQAENNRVLSAGAITYCKDLAKQFIYGYRPEIQTKAMQKGIICEDEAIQLYNDVFFTNHVKNTEHRENDWLTGECDINANIVKDIKTAWSLETFPALKEDCHDICYEWQGRAYMMLYDKPEFELAFCMVSTPSDLIGYEDEGIHIVDHIDPSLRVTTIKYQRDFDLEDLIKVKCEAASKLVNELIERITEDHK